MLVIIHALGLRCKTNSVHVGIMAVPYSKTKENYEIQFGTNHMGHALLTKLLLPTLLSTAEKPGSDVPVINLSSEGHSFAPGIIYDQGRLESYYTFRHYGQSKLANILHARELQRRYPSITATALNPGVLLTNLYTLHPTSTKQRSRQIRFAARQSVLQRRTKRRE